MTGTFGRALAARQIDTDDGKLSSEVTGEIELEGNVLIIRRIRVHYRVRAGEDERETIERVHGMHAERCPVARSLRGAIEIRTSYELIA
ncbi:MAG: OsmC family protein [Candidatus Tectomicrobia bacterium]|uniref:OsmC family protein n=1 Tax=Tectimicrobiota bacterium TaxID=2528274 RepID=A0A932M0D2_UNCTE|nr:OsmC family protein [Candidatus Tectomicrobia bacterium]